MTATTFNTLEFMEELTNAGVKPEEAKAITYATAKAITKTIEINDLATKSDLKSEILKLQLELQQFTLKTTAWTIGIIGSLQTLFHFFPSH